LFPTRFGQLHVRSTEGHGVPVVLLHPSPRSGEMWEALQDRLTRPTYAPDRLGYGFSDAPPWAMSLEQYARCTVDALEAAGVPGQFDVLGVHVGSAEAVEIAHQAPSQVRRLIAVGMPLFTVEEQQRQMEKYSEQPLKPAAEGGHVLGAYDLADAQRRFVEHLLAANPGAALRAASGYPMEKKLKSLRSPLTVFAPHDDLLEQTQRVRPMLKADAAYVDLPDLGVDLFHTATDRMAELINRYLPS
jgi:pimeloyl-ACP methyl ester carboxylesterase